MTVGVMLPARLETRFDHRGPGETARLRVVLVPADVWFDRHDRLVGEDEEALLRSAAQACAGDLLGEPGVAAFGRLADQVGAGRAAWLARAFVTVAPDGSHAVTIPPDSRRRTDDPLSPTVLRDVPSTVELWATCREPAREVLLATLHPKPVLPFAPPDPGGDPVFWPRWNQLRRAGLTATVALAEVEGGAVEPESIAVLTAVGIGESDASALLGSHRDAGVASLVPTGSATNVTPEADVRRPGADAWRQAVTAPPRSCAEVSAALGADLHVPGPATDPGVLQSLLVGGLWPALWGHQLQDLWGWPPGHDDERLGSQRWWQAYVRPEGPFPALLVGDQPYGLLPVTHLRPLMGDADPQVAWTAVGTAAYLEDAAARGERGVGTVVGADTDQVLRVLRQTPVSTGYAYRWAVPLRRARTLYDAWVERMQRVVGDIGLDASGMTDPQVAVGGSAPVTVPIVQPDLDEGEDDREISRRLDVARAMLAGVTGAGGVPERDVALVDELDGQVPLADLIDRYQLLWVFGARLTGQLDLITGWEREAGASLLVRLMAESVRIADRWVAAGQPAGQEVWDAVMGSLRDLARRPAEPPGTLDRGVRATLDCATHRLDVLPTAVATARLRASAGEPRVLGLYAWVDSPCTGDPGFLEDRVVLAPSPAAATTAAILRDRQVEHRAAGEDPEEAWDLHLDSGAVRRAAELVEAVAEGAHPAEALGRRVESCFPRFADVLRLRTQFQGAPDAPSRRTCDGLAAIEAWGDGTEAAVHAFAQLTGIPDSSLTRRVRRELDELARVPATVADAHLAEAVHASVQGGAAATAAALDADAGLGEPIQLRALRTPVPGTSLTTRVHLCLPPALEPEHPDRPALADPVTAAFLDSLGEADDGARFGWSTDSGPVTLADLGLAVSDLAVVDEATLVVAAGAASGAPVPSGVAEARALATLLAGCAAEPGEPRHPDRLRARYAALHAATVAFVADLEASEAGAVPDALRHQALRWGVVWTAGEDPLDLVRRLRANLDACPVPADLEGSPERLVPALRQLAAIGTAGGGRVLVPVLMVPDDGSRPDPLGRLYAARRWQETFERVRPRLAAARTSLLEVRITDVQARGGGRGWTGRPVQMGHGGGTAVARRLDVYLSAGADPLTAPMAVLDEWQETLPGSWAADGGIDRSVQATVGFGFNAPGARAPQAVLLAVAPDDATPLDNALLLRIVQQTRLLARARAIRGRDLGRLGALLPSAMLPADEDCHAVLHDGWDRPTRHPDLHVRLEQAMPEGDIDEGLRARVADPLWMLSRQWQVGEHQGENASSPVLTRTRFRTTPVLAPEDRTFADPVSLPGSAVLEAASRDTVGADGTDPFDPASYLHHTVLRSGGARLPATRHAGGPSDWWAVDAAGRFRSAGPSAREAVPGRMRYPGAPAPGWFTLEDPAETLTAHLPDSSHVGSLFFLDVIAGHATDWYQVPLPTDPGHILTVRSMTVIDSFGGRWPLPASAWPDPATWSMFHTRGLGSRDLLVWPADAPHLEGPVLERAVLGVDEDANVLWVVEDLVEGEPRGDAPPTDGVPRGRPDNAEPHVRYRPIADSPERWHPYPPTTGIRRRFRQALLAADSPRGHTGLPADSSRFAPARLTPVHEIDPAAIPAAGLVVERRWVLARRADGTPVLWQQSTRRTPTASPAMRLPFDQLDPV